MTKVVSSKPVHAEVYSTQHYVINFSVTCDVSVVFFVSITNKTDRHDITEIFLKAGLNTIALTLTFGVDVRLATYEYLLILFRKVSNIGAFDQSSINIS